MSLLLPVGCAVASAVAYGGSTAVQHDAAHHHKSHRDTAHRDAAHRDTPHHHDTPHRDTAHHHTAHRDRDTADRVPVDDGWDGVPAPDHAADAAAQLLGRPDARRLLALLVDPRWLLSVGGDAIGLVLQVIALATGPVVVVQPVLVLAVAVALPVGWALGGPRPALHQVLAGLGVVAALVVFFVLIGDPGSGRRLPPGTAAVTAAATLLIGAALCAAVRRRSARVRAVVFGAVAGAGFGVVGVLLNAAAQVFDADGFPGLAARAGLVPLVSLVVLGAAAMTLTQVSFQVGELSASFPANEVAAPIVAVILGAALLHEHVALSPVLVAAYLVCLVVVVTATVRLAANDPRPPTDAPGDR